ncbi:MAG TPA: diguanylate cyclase [Desulfuromonadales bacterium]|nr:diguanylate cyclase [Desulfuromonadales bacterium]
MFLSRLSIKYQLFIIVSIIALPAICIIINSGLQQRRNAIHNAQTETQKLAEAIVSEQKNLVASTRQLFIALSQLPDVKLRKQVEVKAILAEILKLSPQYINIFIAGPTGVVWASAVPLRESISVSDERYFKNALARGTLSSGEYNIGRVTDKASFILGYPLMDEAGRVTSVICAALSLDYYQHIFRAFKLPQGSSYALIDHKGIILTRAVDPEKYVGKQANPEIFRYMMEGPEEETSAGASSAVGDNRIQTYRKLRLESESTPYMYVRAGIPSAAVMLETNAALGKNLMIYSVSLVVAFFISWLIGKKYIINRVLALERASLRLAVGDLHTRIADEVGGGELGKLGQTFDKMAQRLEDSVRELQHKADEYRTIVQTTSDGFNMSDAHGRILEVNGSFCKMVGYTAKELVTMKIEDIEAIENPEMVAAHIDKIIKAGSDSFISKHKCRDGTEIDVEVTITYLDENGGRFFSFIRDITDRKKMERELVRAANYDSLTGIFNRKSIEEKIEAELERSRRYGSSFSLIMFDVDNFKSINDNLGHNIGDRVLQDIAEIVGQNIRTLDAVGRWGGEEFMILLSGTNHSEAALVAEKLRIALARHRAGEMDNVTASFGMTSCRADDTLDTIFKRVDDLMYAAKSSGKNRIVC